MTEPPLPQTPLSETPLLEMRKVSKEYRGVAALKNIDFQLRRGEVHAIVGENGAGNSTLVKILSGVVAPRRAKFASPAIASRSLVPRLRDGTGSRWSIRKRADADPRIPRDREARLALLRGGLEYERLSGSRFQALSWRAVWPRAFGPRNVTQ